MCATHGIVKWLFSVYLYEHRVGTGNVLN